MSQPAPIVESRTGELSFLLRSQRRGDPLHVRWREAEFPSVANMQTVLDAHRLAVDGEMEPYGLVRVANNLAAAHVCGGELVTALELLSEAEAALVGLIQDVPGPDSKLAVSLAVIKYNASVLMQQAQDPESLEAAELNRHYARKALAQVGEGSENHEARFVAAALSRLGN